MSEQKTIQPRNVFLNDPPQMVHRSTQPELRKILTRELSAGNTIREACVGGFNDDEWLYVFLNEPFRTPIQKDIPGVEYREVNDRHYWKDEYDDMENKQTIAANF